MKKLIILLFISLPFIAGAQLGEFTGRTLPSAIACSDIKECIGHYGSIVADILFVLVLVGGVIAILIGAVNYLFGAKDEKTIEKAKKYITNGVIAVVVAALAYLIVKAVLGTLGV